MIKWKVDKGTNEIYFKASNIFIKNESNITPSRWLKPLKKYKEYVIKIMLMRGLRILK